MPNAPKQWPEPTSDALVPSLGKMPDFIEVHLASDNDPTALIETGYVRVSEIVGVIPQNMQIKTTGRSGEIPSVVKRTMLLIRRGGSVLVTDTPATVHTAMLKAMNA